MKFTFYKIAIVLFFAIFTSMKYAKADNEMAYTTNNGGGFIMFTYSPCVYVSTGVRIPNQFYVYSTSETGVKASDGCFYYKYPFYFITWNSGNKTTININSLTTIKQ